MPRGKAPRPLGAEQNAGPRPAALQTNFGPFAGRSPPVSMERIHHQSHVVVVVEAVVAVEERRTAAAVQPEHLQEDQNAHSPEVLMGGWTHPDAAAWIQLRRWEEAWVAGNWNTFFTTTHSSLCTLFQ